MCICVTTNDQAKLEGSLPCDSLRPPDPKCLQQIRRNMYCALDAHERGVNERFDVLLFAESVIAEIFKPTVKPDCMDEIGRQKMFQLVPDTIT